MTTVTPYTMEFSDKINQETRKSRPAETGFFYRTGFRSNHYLKGGEYIRPPLVHKAFRPRSIPSGVLTPTLRSKISP